MSQFYCSCVTKPLNLDSLFDLNKHWRIVKKGVLYKRKIILYSYKHEHHSRQKFASSCPFHTLSFDAHIVCPLTYFHQPHIHQLSLVALFVSPTYHMINQFDMSRETYINTHRSDEPRDIRKRSAISHLATVYVAYAFVSITGQAGSHHAYTLHTIADTSHGICTKVSAPKNMIVMRSRSMRCSVNVYVANVCEDRRA